MAQAPYQSTHTGEEIDAGIDLADTAIQPAAFNAALGAKANTADLGSAAFQDADSFATSIQGEKADTAVQPDELAAALEPKANTDDLGSAAFLPASDFATPAQVSTAASEAVDEANADTAAAIVALKSESNPFPQYLTYAPAKNLNRLNIIQIGDSRDRQGVTPTGSITTLASYDPVSYAKAASGGRLKRLAIAGNAGFDINETLAVLSTNPPCNASTSTGSGAITTWGLKDVDLSQADIAFIHLGINHFSDFNFTNPDFAAREAVNAPLRAAIQGYAQTLVDLLKVVPVVIWQTEGAVGPASVNFNGGDTIRQGYIWHLKWFNQMLNTLAVTRRNLQVFDVTDILADAANDKFIASRYLTLSTDGTQNAQDMHETHYAYKRMGERLWKMIESFTNKTLRLGVPMAKSEKMSISRDSRNVYTDSLLLGATVPVRVLYGGGTSTTAPVVDNTNVTGVIYPEMALQVNQASGISAGNFSAVSSLIASPTGKGNAIQVDITANVDIDGSFGFVLYNLGASVNAMIDAGFLTFDENKVIQASAWFRAGAPGANPGEIVDAAIFRYYATQFRLRTTGNNQFSTMTAYGASNNSTDYSTQSTGMQLPGQFDGALSGPAIKIDGVTPLTPNRMQSRTMAAPNSNEYWYYQTVAKLTPGQKLRLIIGNVGLYVDALRADGLIPDLI